jgi:hypothetical protein
MIKEKWMEVKKLIKAGWTQREEARNSKGYSVSVTDPKACRFCLVGAIRKTTNEMAYEDHQKMLTQLCAVIGSMSIVDWNDVKGRTKTQVLAALDKVIEVAQ